MNVLAALLEARTGQQIAANRTWRIDTALRPIAHERALPNVDALVTRLLDGRDAALTDRVIDAMLNQETSFFRDAGVIEAAANAIAALDAPAPRIWCAGCSTGQEPLSLAMAFAERGGVVPEIVATDVSKAAIARARTGRFTQFEVQRGLPIRRLIRWFEESDGAWIARPDLLQRISWRRQNLVADLPPGGRYDAIFCRNVLFYLAPGLRAQVLGAIAQALRPDGLLILGAGETVIGQSDAFVPSRRFRGLYEIASGDPNVVYKAG
ncbi:protein-glutamate O-methyltransferase CheR [Sphingomonas sp. NBWT7]|nr:protein-glutamate O-methyltransferase CheR [Sphingomonas sp. NBWT7]